MIVELVSSAERAMTGPKYLILLLSTITMFPFFVVGLKKTINNVLRKLYGPSLKEINKAINIIEEVQEKSK